MLGTTLEQRVSAIRSEEAPEIADEENALPRPRTAPGKRQSRRGGGGVGSLSAQCMRCGLCFLFCIVLGMLFVLAMFFTLGGGDVYYPPPVPDDLIELTTINPHTMSHVDQEVLSLLFSKLSFPFFFFFIVVCD